MHGDISRSTFDPDLAFSSVRLQQGRVQLDADWNEQRDIELHDERRLRRDAVGVVGAPLDDAGFAVTATAEALQIGAGRCYVDGIHVANPAPFTVGDTVEGDGLYLVYLDVWEQPVTAVEAPHIREVALGGPDTATRTRVRWQVRLLELGSADPAAHCLSEFPEWSTLAGGPTGTVAVRAQRPEDTADLCAVPESAGYTGLENRTYRVQIHDGDFDAGAAPTFVWSRDNGAIVAAWISDPAGGLEIEIDRLGAGAAEGFERGGWVELTNDARDAAGLPGILAEVDDIRGATVALVDDDGLGARLDAIYDPDLHPKVRRWDSPGALPLDPGTWTALEDGVEVRFAAGGTWRSGDHWIIPARTPVLPGTGDRHLGWPVDDSGDPVDVGPHGFEHHVARVALASLVGDAWTVEGDCRTLFAPITDALTLTAAGGEGQHGPGHAWLPGPLRVAVTRGIHPVEDARVRLRVRAGGGRLSPAQPDESGTAASEVTEVSLVTAADGVATAWWRLGPTSPPEEPGDRFHRQAAQEVVAEYLDASGGVLGAPVIFTAVAIDPLVLVAAGGDGQLGRPGDTLEIALRARVSAGSTPAAGRQVAFRIESRMLDGGALDEFRGGSLHASAGVVSTEPWPGGSRTLRAIVATDDDGLAQVQWILGTETRLPVQRVLATLLDDDGAETAQSTLFTAHLALASEIGWDPCALLGRRSTTVQDALSRLCDLLGALASDGVVVTSGGEAPLIAETVVPFGDLRSLRVRLPLAVPADPPREALDAAVSVWAEAPVRDAPTVLQPLFLVGGIEVERREADTTVHWSPADLSPLRGQLRGGPLRIRVEVRPGLLTSGRRPTSVPWHGAFRLGG